MIIQSAYNFLFHPLHEEHSTFVKGVSLVVGIALAFFSYGVWAAIFAAVHLLERVKPTGPPMSKLEAFRGRHKQQVDEFRRWAADKKWRNMAVHTKGFDWWAFPVDLPSNGYGARYQFTEEEIAELKRDPLFMAEYREGVRLVALSWGWQIEERKAVEKPDPGQGWGGWTIRLLKMTYSLQLFGEEDWIESLREFSWDIDVELDESVARYVNSKK